MPETPPGNLPVDAYKQWKPDAQAKALNLLRESQNNEWRPFYCPNHRCNGQPHVWPVDERECPNPYGHQWRKDTRWACAECGVDGTQLDDWDFNHARPDQRPPRWDRDWLTLLLRGGRGSGKTRTGGEIANRVSKRVRRMTLIGPTGPDFRAIMVEGESGILATSPPGERPVWEPSKKQLTWPNGCIAQGYSAEEPDRLRGQNSGFIWADEPAHWDLVQECWDNMLFGLRKGEHPKIVATSTPKPTKWMKELAADPFTIDRRVSSYANLANLSPVYRRTVLDPKEGTRIGRQELHGEILEDVEGALWAWEMFHWAEQAPALQRIVVSVDPAGTANKRSDETGIIVIGIGHDRKLYVLADYTGKFSPDGWGRRAWEAVERFEADAIVYEKNYGGEMVHSVLEKTSPAHQALARLIPVTSRRGKDVRAEPIVALYERAQVLHVGQRGDLAKLEEEQTTWVPGPNSPSPNRVDALVHGATELAKNVMPAAISSPTTLNERYRPSYLRVV